jgi:hypothetical protein
MVKKYAAQIMRQDIGYAILKYDPVKPAILLRTPAPGSREFPNVEAGPTLLRECQEHVYQRLDIPTAVQARAAITARRERVLELGAGDAEAVEDEVASSLGTRDRETKKRRAAARARR